VTVPDSLPATALDRQWLLKQDACHYGRHSCITGGEEMKGLTRYLPVALLISAASFLAEGACSEIYPPAAGWAIDLCTDDPEVTTPMEVVLDGVSQGMAVMVRVYHETDDGASMPQVAVIYSSGFVRLKQNADPTPPTPFGSSFVLGPAYWPDQATYHHSPQLTRIEIDTGWLPSGPLRFQAVGSNQDFDVEYRLTLPPPRDRQTRLHVDQRYTATTGITIDPIRISETQGLKLVQISSMFINEGAGCDFGSSDCHDSNGARYIGADLTLHQVVYSDLTPSTLVFASPQPLGSTWLDALHSDNSSWQGNTPNVRIALDRMPQGSTVTPQGWITASTDPNDDNVSLWLNDDDPAAHTWSPDDQDEIGYWLLVQDDPPDPWADHDLRPGVTFLDMEEGSGSCVFVRDAGQSTSGRITVIDGYNDHALELQYDLGTTAGSWVQMRCDLDPPLDLSAHDHLRFEWRGDADTANSIEVALITRSGGQDSIFGRGYHHVTHHGWWGQMVVPFQFLHPWSAGTTLSPGQVTAFFVSVVVDPAGDTGGAGTLAIDNVGAFKLAGRSVPASRERAPGNDTAATTAADWLVAQQQPSGLVKSWQEEAACVSHTYDQALALLVFLDDGRSSEAEALVTALVATQNPDGSWYKSRSCDTLEPVGTEEWEGDVAWAVYALSRYLVLGGSRPDALATRNRAADWLVSRFDPLTCTLTGGRDHTEGTIDLWWALTAAGMPFEGPALEVERCLLSSYWDDGMGRFKGGISWWQPYLDNQTWGGALLRKSGFQRDALCALGFASAVLKLPARGGQLVGLDGQGGPWSIWNEGTAQYVSIGGPGAADLVEELLVQQRTDGAMPGSADEFAGGGVWTTTWHGVAPTAWLYLALTGSPFPEPLDELIAGDLVCGDMRAWSVTRRTRRHPAGS
jgi:hypothetical protein